VWAVGTYIDTTYVNSHALLEHYNGSAWSVVPVTSPVGEDQDLDSIAIIPGTHQFLVSGLQHGQDSPGESPLVEGWNGTDLIPQTVPAPAGAGDELLGVTARNSSEAWTVGAGPLIEHYK
jgi:hypothetical protein